MELQRYGVRRYPATSALLASSAATGWSAVFAELRAHANGEAPPIVPQYVEICMVVSGNDDSLVGRRGDGFSQTARATNGTLWLSPAGISKQMSISAPIPETLHLYLPTAPFDRLKDDFALPGAPWDSIRMAAGVHDEVIAQIGRSILCELTGETSGGQMYVETASLMLAARLLQQYCDAGSPTPATSLAHGLDHARLRRVFDYVADNLEGNITLGELAGVAGYSPFHFARKFAMAAGTSPHRYVSQMRLEKAMAELAQGKLGLAEIALNANFSSQSSFTRAFHRATGMTPREYQRQRL